MPEHYRLDILTVLQEVQSNQETGLSQQEAQKRLEQYGPNALPHDAGVNWLELIWGQFNDPLIWLLIFAAIVSAALGEVTDMVVISIIVILNAVLGIYQEYQAEQALAALSAMQVPKVTIRRDGQIHQISAEDIVPGDIVLLEEGDSVPADGRVISSNSLRVQEAALTGESLPVSKDTDPIPGNGKVGVGDRSNMVFMGTAVNYGRGEFVVTRTGLQTEIGNIAAMLLQVEEGITPLQRRLNQLGQFLAIGAMIVVAIVFVVGLIVRGIPPQEMFLIA
ncbi:MAG: HAD-IC family P-type ATPase, partial [Anaerolineae bacterium]|nr:HAD-IC family P-type ATPase [Anaerolineae bacterium]